MRIAKIVHAMGKVQEAHAAIKIKEGEAIRLTELNIQIKRVQYGNNKVDKGQRVCFRLGAISREFPAN